MFFGSFVMEDLKERSVWYSEICVVETKLNEKRKRKRRNCRRGSILGSGVR